MFDVVALGELLIDFSCAGNNLSGYPVMSAQPGGAPCNLLAALTKLGASTAFLGKVGCDQFGELLRNTLNDIGVNTDGLISDTNVFTTLAFVSLDEHGERSFSFARKPGADTQLTAEELKLSLIDQCKIFHFGSLSLTHEPSRSATRRAIEYAKAAGAIISFDPNLRLPLWSNPEEAKAQILWGMAQADIVKISDEEISFLFNLSPEPGVEYILNHFPAQLVFVTCGAKGCFYGNKLASGHVDAPSGLHTIDTTGAGDIFCGAALWKLLQVKTTPNSIAPDKLCEMARFACAAASLSTTKPGGLFSAPDLHEINTLLPSL